MRSTFQDRGLVAIVAGALLLVVIAFVVVLRQGPAEYRNDAAPDAAVHNYLLAIQQSDYARAYTYLAPTIKGYPADVGQFTADIVGAPYMFGQDRREGVAVGATNIVNDELATVGVEVTQFSGGDLFGSSRYSYTFQVTLARSDAGWQITNADQYWQPCWTDGMCR